MKTLPENIQRAVTTVRKVLDPFNPRELDIDPATDIGFITQFNKEKGEPDVQGVAHILLQENRFVFFLEFLKNAPADSRQAVSEFITRANFGISIGNFEMNFGDGLVRYKVSIEFTSMDLPENMVRNAILSAMDAVEMYHQVLYQIYEGKLSPKEAIRQAEEE